MSSAIEADQPQGWYQRFKNSVKKIKREVLAVYYALEDPEVGWLPQAVGILAISYALSPVDLIPDFIPILGLIDDLIILPALLLLVVYLIPPEIMEQARDRASREPLRLASNWIAALVFFLIWNATFAWISWLLVDQFGSDEVKDAQWFIVGGVLAVVTVGEIVWAVLQVQKERRKKEAVQEPLLHAAVEEP